MKKIASIKTRITIWYTAIMFVLVSVVLIMTGIFSYHMSMKNIESNLQNNVNEIAQRVGGPHSEEFSFGIEKRKEFRNVSIYRDTGEYIAGRNDIELGEVPFKEFHPHKETVDGKEYIVYDVFKPSGPGERTGFWVRGVESIELTKIFSHSFFVIILIIIPIILLLTAIGGYYITRKAFSPINEIIKTATEISANQNISQRIFVNPEAKKDELFSLSVTLNQMLDKIEELIRQEQQFTSDAAHELRTPLSVILAQGEYMADIADTDKEKELAEGIVSKAKQMSNLVSRLLFLARIDSNRQKLNLKKTNLGTVAKIAVEDMQGFADEKGVSVTTDIVDGVYVLADEALMLSAITNLISNAIKYSKDSGVVKVSVTKSENTAEITVEDDGIGISENNMKKIWDRFYRVDDVRNDDYGSSGLGLSVVKSIVKLHKGEIFAESKLDCGTKLKIVLRT